MSYDGAHYPDRSAHEADRMLDEHDERLERADREADKTPATNLNHRTTQEASYGDR